jgi:hypothetical protein
MKIDAYGNIKNASAAKKRVGVSSGSDFSSLLSIAESEEAGQAAKLSDIAATSALSGMLALQEVSEEEIRRKKLIKQGESMLDSLEQLRRKLLVGSLPMDVLNNIRHNLSIQRQGVADPRLLEIMDEIELRTAVELAKLEMAIASRSTLE